MRERHELSRAESKRAVLAVTQCSAKLVTPPKRERLSRELTAPLPVVLLSRDVRECHELSRVSRVDQTTAPLPPLRALEGRGLPRGCSRRRAAVSGAAF